MCQDHPNMGHADTHGGPCPAPADLRPIKAVHSGPSPIEAIDGLQEARDLLWSIQRECESDGTINDEIEGAVLAMDKLFVKEIERWEKSCNHGQVAKKPISTT